MSGDRIRAELFWIVFQRVYGDTCGICIYVRADRVSALFIHSNGNHRHCDTAQTMSRWVPIPSYNCKYHSVRMPSTTCAIVAIMNTTTAMTNSFHCQKIMLCPVA